MLASVGKDKFEIVMMATISMVKDHFLLTRQLIEKESRIIIDRLEAANGSDYIHPVNWENYVPKSKEQKARSILRFPGIPDEIIYHKEVWELEY